MNPLGLAGVSSSSRRGVSVTSSGVPALDALLGGGLAVGSLTLVEADEGSIYADHLLRIFLAEGLASGQAAAALSPSPAFLGHALPALAETVGKTKPSSAEESGLSEEASRLRIAWRYEASPAVQSSLEGAKASLAHSFDLHKEADASLLRDYQLLPVSSENSARSGWETLLSRLSTEPHSAEAGDAKAPRRFLRLGLTSLGASTWRLSKAEQLALVCRLKLALRSAHAAAVLLLPNHADEELRRRLRSLCDCAVGLESFAGTPSEAEPLLREHHGRLLLHRLPAFGGLRPATTPDCFDLVFKMKRNRLEIQRLHLPPDEAAAAEAQAQGGGCGSGGSGSAKLDF